MLKNLKIIFVTIAVLSMLVGCSCNSSTKEDSGLNTPGSAQETTTASVDNETKIENETDSSIEETVIETETNSENISESIEDIETTKRKEETEATKETQKTEESQTTKKQQSTKETETTKKQQSTKETETTKKQQTTKKPETSKNQETTTKKTQTPAVKEKGVIYDTLIIQYVNKPYSVPGAVGEFVKYAEEREGITINLDEVDPNYPGTSLPGYAIAYSNTDEYLPEANWNENTVKVNPLGNELRMATGTGSTAEQIKSVYGEPFFYTDLDEMQPYNIMVYKYKTNNKNNEYEMFIIFALFNGKFEGMSYGVATEEIMRMSVESFKLPE